MISLDGYGANYCILLHTVGPAFFSGLMDGPKMIKNVEDLKKGTGVSLAGAFLSIFEAVWVRILNKTERLILLEI